MAGLGQVPAGEIVPPDPSPTKTMFQLAPFHPPRSELRVNHCCWLPGVTVPSTSESAR